MKTLKTLIALASLCVMTACSGNSAPDQKVRPATTAQASLQTLTSHVNGKTFILSATPTHALQPGIARQYGIEQRDDTTMVLVSVTDASGNAIDPGTAQVTVSAGIVPATPTEIAMKPIQVEGFANLVGIVTAKPPVKLIIQMMIQDGDAQTSQSFTRDVLPR